jgi:hypothetical protein
MPTRCYSFFSVLIACSACFGHHYAHRQKLKSYTRGCCLWYIQLTFSDCRYGVEMKVVFPVCGLLLYLFKRFNCILITNCSAVSVAAGCYWAFWLFLCRGISIVIYRSYGGVGFVKFWLSFEGDWVGDFGVHCLICFFWMMRLHCCRVLVMRV